MSRAKLLATTILATMALFGATAATQAASHGPQPQATNAQATPPLLLQGNDPDEPGGDTDFDSNGSGIVQGQDRNAHSIVEGQDRGERRQTGENEGSENGEQGED